MVKTVSNQTLGFMMFQVKFSKRFRFTFFDFCIIEIR